MGDVVSISDLDVVDPKDVERYTPPPSQTSDFVSHALSQITGGVGALFHPIDTISSMLDDAKSELNQARENLNSGKHADAAYHLGNAVPVIGPLIRSMSEEGSQEIGRASCRERV